MGEINMLIRAYFVVLVVLAAALLAGCGSSSKTSSASTNASAATATIGTTSTGTKAAKGSNAGGLAKPPAARSPITTPALKRAFTKFAMCIRESGVKFPLPNTSGKGPIFSAKGVDIRSAKFKAASIKCRGDLLGALRAHRGTVKTQGTAGSPGAAGQTKPSPAPKLKVKVPPKVTHVLQQFTACMRESGVTNYPEPEGASFNLSHTHIDTKSAQYKAAEKKCNPILNAAF
jgi:outer membrane murein-binding lipoprotein Lpp